MKGLNVICDDSLKVRSYNDEFNLLLYKKNLEIMSQKISSNSSVWIDPASEEVTIEFFYILKGSAALIYKGIEYKIKAGDSFYTEKLEDKVYMKIEEEIEMIYVTNGKVAQEVFDFQNQVYQLINEVDSKDNKTASHSSRVRKYAESLCNVLIKEYPIKYSDIIMGSIIHDVGKTKIPEMILRKKEPLTSSEQDIMNLHVKYGAEIADKFYGSNVARLVMNHHERYDGSGLFGLQKEELDIDSSIIIVCDVFDGLVNDSYSLDKKTFLEAAEYLYNQPDKFDRRVTTILLRLVKENEIN